MLKNKLLEIRINNFLSHYHNKLKKQKKPLKNKKKTIKEIEINSFRFQNFKIRLTSTILQIWRNTWSLPSIKSLKSFIHKSLFIIIPPQIYENSLDHITDENTFLYIRKMKNLKSVSLCNVGFLKLIELIFNLKCLWNCKIYNL